MSLIFMILSFHSVWFGFPVQIGAAKPFELGNLNAFLNGPKFQCIDTSLPKNEILCEQTYEKFCAEFKLHSPVTRQSIIEQVKKSEGAQNTDNSKQVYAANVLREIYLEGERYGVTGEKLDEIVAQVKTLAVSTISNQNGFSEQLKKSDPDLQSSLIEKVKAIKLVTPLSPNFDIRFFTEVCGADGLEQQIYYSPDDNSLTVCTGFILLSLQQKNLENLYLNIGHEVGHSVDAFIEDKNGLLTNFKNYLPYLSCVENSDQKLFNDGKPFYDRYNHVFNTASKCYADAEASAKLSKSDLEALGTYLHHLNFIQPYVVGMYKKSEGRNVVAVHASELTADLMGRVSLAAKLSVMPADRRAVTAETALSYLCNAKKEVPGKKAFDKVCLPTVPKEDLAFFTSDAANEDDGTHPTDAYRFYAVLSSKEIRAALGCRKPLQKPPVQDCGYSGEKNAKPISEGLKNFHFGT